MITIAGFSFYPSFTLRVIEAMSSWSNKLNDNIIIDKTAFTWLLWNDNYDNSSDNSVSKCDEDNELKPTYINIAFLLLLVSSPAAIETPSVMQMNKNNLPWNITCDESSDNRHSKCDGNSIKPIYHEILPVTSSVTIDIPSVVAIK